jgi:hypothetical protein
VQQPGVRAADVQRVQRVLLGDRMPAGPFGSGVRHARRAVHELLRAEHGLRERHLRSVTAPTDQGPAPLHALVVPIELVRQM